MPARRELTDQEIASAASSTRPAGTGKPVRIGEDACGVAEPREEHSACIANWLKGIRKDSRFILRAPANAQRAADILVALQFDPDETAA